MTAHQPITLDVRIERKQASLPRFAVVPATLVADWGLAETTSVDVRIDEERVERRRLKRWDADSWFVSITEADCRRVRVDTGDRVQLTLSLVVSDLPPELTQLLESDPQARAAWDGRSASQRRQLREEILQAKAPATKRRRARKALLGS